MATLKLDLFQINVSSSSNGQVLTSNGTQAYWANTGSGGFSNGQSIQVANLIVNGYFTSANTLLVGNSTVNTYITNSQIAVNQSAGVSNVAATFLIVAGGGGGGANRGGGGGAGGMVTPTSNLSTSYSYTVTVGAGGVGQSGAVASAQGSNSSVIGTGFSNTAVGGGRGGGNGGPGGSQGDIGGSGGGGGSTGASGAAGISGQGNAGGNSVSNFGGGGGGKGGAGANDLAGRAGGAGASFLGVTYATGGTGGAQQNGAGGGGAGTTNTGNGGDGGSGDVTGGAGGSGIVILTYPGSAVFSGGTITSNGSNTVHTFTTSGTLVPTVSGSATSTTITSTYISTPQLYANGYTGSSGSVLTSNSTGGIYWSTTVGYTGSAGYTGSQGPAGEFGGAAFNYIYSTNTTHTSSPNGYFNFTNTTFSSVNTLSIDYIDNYGANVYSFLQTIDDSTSAIKGHFSIRDTANDLNYALFSIVGAHTEHTDHFDVPVSYLSGVTSFTNGTNTVITFARTGNIGDTGYTGSIGTTGYSGSIGFTGSTGTGYTGSIGSLGYTGSIGAGYTGSVGYVGSSATGTAGDEFINQTTLLLHFNGANGSSKTIDSSIQNTPIYMSGSAILSRAQYKFGNTSLLVTNTTAGRAYTNAVANGSVLDLITSSPDYTIEAWAYPRAIPNAAANEYIGTVLAFGPLGYGAGGGYAITGIGINSGGYWYGQFNSNNQSTGDRNYYSLNTATLNTWTHIAFTRYSNTYSFFVNGTLQSSNTINESPRTSASNTWSIGSGPNGTYKFDGYIDDVRITKGVARYTSSFIAPDTEHPNGIGVQGYTGSSGSSSGGTTVTVSATAPVSPTANSLWWNTESGTLYIYYNDGDTSQWVATSSQGAVGYAGSTGSIGYTGSGGVSTGKSIAMSMIFGG